MPESLPGEVTLNGGWEDRKAGPQSPAPLCSCVVAMMRMTAHTSQQLPQSHWGHSHGQTVSAWGQGSGPQGQDKLESALRAFLSPGEGQGLFYP